jgi:hypothetical protein
LTEFMEGIGLLMKRRILSHFLTALAASALVFTGCETTENRISENQNLFNSLSASDQALVSRGQIRSGMSQQAVWLAWGNPENKTHGEMRGRATETWIYVQTTTAPYGSAYYPFYGYGAGPYFGGGFGGGGFVTRHHHGRSFFFYGDPLRSVLLLLHPAHDIDSV